MTVDGANPHHRSQRDLLRPDAPLGIPALLRAALEGPLGAIGADLGPVRVDDAPARLPGRQDVVVQVVIPVHTARESTDLVLDLPYVSMSGSIIGRERDVAPIAFLRTAPGTWLIAEGEDDPLDLAASADERAVTEALADVWPELDPWTAVEGRALPALVHVPELLEPVTVTLGPDQDRRIRGDGIGGASAALVIATLDRLERIERGQDDESHATVRSEVGRTAWRLAMHLRRIEAHDETFVARPFVLGEVEVPADHRFPDEASLLEDLDRCRLLLAGHHLTAAVDRGARDAARQLPSSIEPGWLGTVVQRIGAVIDQEVQRTLRGSRRHPDGGSAPFEPIDDTNPLARFEHARKVSRLGPGGIALKSRSAMALRDVHPSHIGRLCPFNTPESDRVGLVRHLTLDAAVRADGRFEPVTGELAELPRTAVLSASALLLPALNHDDAVRGVLAAKSIRQFVPLVAPDRPVIETGDEAAVSARMALGVEAVGARVEITPEGVLIERDARGVRVSAELPLRTHPGSLPTSGTDDRRIPVGFERAGRDTRRGELILRQPGTVVSEGAAHLAPGVNARCAVLPFQGLTVEDAVVVSMSLAERMRSSHLERIVEVLAPDELTDVNPRRLRGEMVLAGQDLFRVVATRPDDHVDGPATVDADDLVRRAVSCPFTGEVIEVHRVPRASGESEVRILVRVERHLAVGDKVTARHGNKGVVAAVLPDDAMPQIQEADGTTTPAEVVLNPVGPLRRMVVGLLHELAWSRVAASGTAVPPLPALDQVGVDAVVEAVTGQGLGWTSPVVLPDGRRVEEAAVGTVYLLKLNHLADRKLQVQDWTYATAATGQPAPVRVDEGGRLVGRPGRLGEMEHWALQAYGATALLRDADAARRGVTSGMPSSLWAVLDNLHAAGIVARLTFRRPDGTDTVVDDSRQYIAVHEAAATPGTRLRELTLDLAERRRLALAAELGSTLPDEPTPDTVLAIEDVFAAAKAVRDNGRLATPRAADNRTRRNENPTTRQVLEGEGWIDEAPELVCRCGRQSEPARGASVCQTCRRVRRRHPGLQSAHHIGHLALHRPVVHPWLVAPFWRAARTLANADPATAELLRAAAPDHEGDGLPLVRDLRAGAADELAVIARCLDLLTAGDPPAVRPLASDVLSMTISYLPLLPPAHRRATKSDSGPVAHPLLGRYRAVEAAARAASGPVSYERLRSAVANVLGSATGDPRQDTLAHRLRRKEGLLRRYLLGGRAWNTAYGVIVPGLDLCLDEVGLPSSIRRELRLDEGDVVLVNRSPTLLRTGMLGMRVRAADGGAIQLPPAVLPMFAGDFDGDMVAIHRPDLPAARAELHDLLHPAASLWSPADGALLLGVGEELQIDPVVRTDLDALAERVRRAYLDDDAAALTSAQEALRDRYRDAYASATGRASVSLGSLIGAFEPDGALAEARLAGFGDAQLAQCTTAIGSTETYASRLGRAEPAAIGGRFVDGLDRAALVANVRGAMVRLGDKKLATPAAGDFTKVLVESLYSLSVVDGDCGAAGIPRTLLSERADRRGDGPTVRTPLACKVLAADPDAVCAACYGDDVSTGRPVCPGARVGVLAATAIGERGTQLALKSIHVGARQTQLDRLRRGLASADPVPVPVADAEGRLALDDGDARTASLAEDPLAIVHLMRWLLTPDAARSQPRAAAGVDDVHLELAVGSLAAGAAADSGRSPIAVAFSRHDPLSRSTSRGQLTPILRALAGPPEGRTVTAADPRAAVFLTSGAIDE